MDDILGIATIVLLVIGAALLSVAFGPTIGIGVTCLVVFHKAAE